jgi:hypothetical protein
MAKAQISSDEPQTPQKSFLDNRKREEQSLRCTDQGKKYQGSDFRTYRVHVSVPQQIIAQKQSIPAKVGK